MVQGWGSPLNIVFFYNGVSNNGSYPIVVSINSCRVLARLRDARPGKGDGGRGGSHGSFDCSLGRSPPIYPLYISYISPIYFLYISYISPGKGDEAALEAWIAARGDLLNAKFLPLLLNEFGAN